MPISVASQNAIIETFSIVVGDGWVPLSTTPEIVAGVLDCRSNLISIRYQGGDASLLRTNTLYPIDGVNLADYEISTSSGVNVVLVVFAYTIG